MIGGGPSGLALATTLAEKGFSVCILERNEELGGLLDQCIHDGFGTKLFDEGLSGPEFAERFIEKLADSSIEVYRNSYVKSVELVGDKKKIVVVSPTGVHTLFSRCIVYALGCRERNHFEIQIGGSRPAGVYTAGYMQRLINLYGIIPGKNIVIVGGGDVGMIVARHLVLEGVSQVLMVYPEAFFVGLPRNVQQCILDFDIPFRPRTIVKNIVGKDRIQAVELVCVDKDWKSVPGTEEMVACDTLILSVGLIPYAEKLVELGAHIDDCTRGPWVNECFETTVEGVFAIGNLVQIFDYVDDAVETSFIAADGVEQYLVHQKQLKKNVQLRPGSHILCVTPQRIDGCLPMVTVFFRSCITKKNAEICLRNEKGDMLFSTKKPFIRPSTLECIRVESSVIVDEDVVVIDVE